MDPEGSTDMNFINICIKVFKRLFLIISKAILTEKKLLICPNLGFGAHRPACLLAITHNHSQKLF